MVKKVKALTTADTDADADANADADVSIDSQRRGLFADFLSLFRCLQKTGIIFFSFSIFFNFSRPLIVTSTASMEPIVRWLVKKNCRAETRQLFTAGAFMKCSCQRPVMNETQVNPTKFKTCRRHMVPKTY